MNANDLLDLMNNTKDKFVMEAMESRAGKTGKKVLRLNRVALVAAILAVMLVLAGCVAVFLRLQDMSVGQDTYIQRYDPSGKAIEPTEKVRQYINFSGYDSSPAQMASKEWYEFCESYDPEHKLMTNEPDLPDIPNDYEYCYGCYTPEMVQKLDEIAEKYDLNLLGLWVSIQRWQSDIALNAIGTTSLLKEGAQAEMGEVSGMLYPPYNFKFEFDMKLTGEDALWTKRLYATAVYRNTHYVPSQGGWFLDLENYDQWSYTTSDGTKLLLALGKYNGSAFLVAEQKDAFYTIEIDSNINYTDYPDPADLITKEGVEQVAEVFDFSLIPTQIDADAMQADLEAAEAAYQAENTYIPPTYGDFTELMKESNWYWIYDMQYAFYDINEDGTDDLLLGNDGMLSYWYTMRDGIVEEHFGNTGYLCEDGILEVVDTMFEYSSFLRYTYSHLDKGIITEEDPEMLTHYKGKWYDTTEYLWLNTFDTTPTITEDEAKAIRSQYTHIELDWKPIFDYPLDEEGSTLGEYAKEQDVRLSDGELVDFYADWWKPRQERNDWITHYAIRDVNGDGVADLLLSGDGEKYWEAYTYRYGGMQLLSIGDAYLCEDGIFEQVGERQEHPGIVIDEYVFYTLDGFNRKILDYVAYDKSTTSWMSDYDFTPMSEADAQEILNQYTPIDQGLRPISELVG